MMLDTGQAVYRSHRRDTPICVHLAICLINSQVSPTRIPTKYGDKFKESGRTLGDPGWWVITIQAWIKLQGVISTHQPGLSQ